MTDREMLEKALKTIEELCEWKAYMGGFEGLTWHLAARTRADLCWHLETTKEVT